MLCCNETKLLQSSIAPSVVGNRKHNDGDNAAKDSQCTQRRPVEGTGEGPNGHTHDAVKPLSGKPDENGNGSADEPPDGHGHGHDEEPDTLWQAAMESFLGHCSRRFKIFVVAALVINVPVRYIFGTTVGAWLVLLEFLVTLAMALEAYPLQAGGLLVIEANLIGLTNPHTLLHEVTNNLNVILMIIFMVASIHFLKSLLLWIFTKILLQISNKIVLSVVMLLVATVMSAFLDALTVSAVVVSVCTGFLGVYYHVVKNSRLPRLNHLRKYRRRQEIRFQDYVGTKVGAPERKASKRGRDKAYSEDEVKEVLSKGDYGNGEEFEEPNGPRDTMDLDDINLEIPALQEIMARKISVPKLGESTPGGKLNDEEMKLYDDKKQKLDDDISRFNAFLRSLLMHCAVGTTFGGIMTMVGEPQNLIIAERMEWTFGEFMIKVAPVWATVLPCGIVVCILLEKFRRFGYGAQMPDDVREVLTAFEQSEYGKMTSKMKAQLGVQCIGAVLLVCGLIFHIAEVGFIGLMVVILLTSLNGITEEHEIAHAFLESMPFVSLLVVFFGIVGMIHDQELFAPIIDAVLGLEESLQTSVLFMVNGVLSMVSDNVFVATIFVDEIHKKFNEGLAADGSGNGASVEHHAAAAHGHSHHRVLAEHMSRKQYERLGISIVSGTNLPSMATPNGQASLLFILTSNIAPLVHLSYRKMCIMTLPYTIVATAVGLFAIIVLLPLVDS
jgi:Na+/H+ antiporter NhaB